MTSAIAAGHVRRICCFSCWPIIFSMLLPGCAEKIDTPQEYLELAYRHERDQQLPEAVAAYRKSLELDNKQATVWYDLGVAFAAMDQFPEAIEAYSKAIDLDQNMARAFNNRAAAYARLKQFRSAIADLDRAIGLDPDDSVAWRNRGLAKHDVGEIDGAISDYDESIRINGRTAESYHYRGNAFLDRKQWARALEDFNQAVRMDATMGAAQVSRSIALARMGRRDEAESALSKAKKLGSDPDEIVLEDLLPNQVPADVEVDVHRMAVDFVRSAFSNQHSPLEPAEAPWDLRENPNNSEHRYVVRVVATSGNHSSVNFSSDELDQIGKSNFSTTLIIVQPVDRSTNDSQAPFRITRTIEQWMPDRSTMQPVTWALPVPVDPAEVESAPVATTLPQSP